MFKRLYFLFLFSGIVMLPVVAHASNVADHAPVGVMGDHYHSKGEWMASYRYMSMDMRHNYSGTKELTVANVHNQYMISPVHMSMNMHMVGLMRGFTDDVTGMVMLPYMEKQADMRRRSDGKDLIANTNGLGDIKLSGIFALKNAIDLPIHLNFGVSLPTGSINQQDDTFMGDDQPLPYGMQLGSGTFAILPGITYFDKHAQWSWGVQESSTLQLGKNEQKYQIGDQHVLTSWLAYTWAEWISTSVRVKGSMWGNINGADQRLNPNMMPTADPNLRGGERIDLFLGANLLGEQGAIYGHRIAVEVGYPVYQSLDGPQLGAGWQCTLGWQKAW